MSDYNELLISQAGGDGDVLGEIEARIPKIPSSEMSNTEKDRATLLAMVREQAVKIERAELLADSFDELASHASYNGTEAEMETWLSAALRIRATLRGERA